MRRTSGSILSLVAFALVAASLAFGADGKGLGWQAGIGRRVITPQTPVWLAGYGSKRAPDGKIHDLWVKSGLAPDGKRVVMATTDHMGMSKTICNLFDKVKRRLLVDREDFMLTFRATTAAPRSRMTVTTIPDEAQRKLIAAYST